MKSFGLALKNELFKLAHKKKYIVFLVIGILFCLINAGIPILISTVTDGNISLKSNVILNMLPFTVSVLTPFAVFLAATDLFAGEFAEDTMKGTLAAPVTRFKLLAAKAAAILLLSAVYFAVMYMVSLFLQLASGTGMRNIFTGLAAYALDLVPMLCVIGLAILVNLLVKSPGLASLTSVAVYALMVYLNYFSAAVGRMLFTAYMQWHNLLIGTALPFTAFVSKLGIIVGSGLILFSVSYIMFDRRDV